MISTLAGTDPSFPKNLWDLLLPMVDMTLAILRPSCIIANTSSWDFIHRKNPFDFTKTPFGPAGCKVLVYESAASRSSMSDHGVEGYFIGPALEYYRCFTVYIPSTKSIRISDTVSWHINDPTHTLSNHTTNDTIQLAIISFTDKLLVTSDVSEKNHINRCIAALQQLILPPSQYDATIQPNQLPLPVSPIIESTTYVPLTTAPISPENITTTDSTTVTHQRVHIDTTNPTCTVQPKKVYFDTAPPQRVSAPTYDSVPTQSTTDAPQHKPLQQLPTNNVKSVEKYL